MHLDAKRFFATWSRFFLGRYTSVVFEYEVPLPEIRRVADLLLTFPMGTRLAYEIQLSAITTEELERRSDDYARAGIDVVWWLGKSADTLANRRWFIYAFGKSYSIGSVEDRGTTGPFMGASDQFLFTEYWFEERIYHGMLRPRYVMRRRELSEGELSVLVSEGTMFLAFVHYFELWGKASRDAFAKGVRGAENARVFFDDFLAQVRRRGSVVPLSNGEWDLVQSQGM